MATPQRKTVPLPPDLADALDRMRTRGTDEAAVAAELIGIDTVEASEAQTLAAVIELFSDELGREWGAVSSATMRQVDLALRRTLGIRWCPAR